MSKKVARTLSTSAGRSARGRRRVKPHIRKAAGRSLMLAFLAIPACVYLLYCLCHIGGKAHFHLNLADTSHPQDGSPWGDKASMMRQSATEPHPH